MQKWSKWFGKQGVLMYYFKNKVVIVTGAAQGIGQEVAKQFAHYGAKVYAIDIQVSDTLDENRINHIEANVADSKRINQVINKIIAIEGKIDVLANVAGILKLGKVDELSDQDWQACFDVNTFGVFNLCRAVVPYMKKARSGAIVTVGSNAAHVPRMDMAAYGASKSATKMFCKCLALELAEFGVRCNQVSPGSTDTPMQRNMWADNNGEKNVLRGFAESYKVGIPLQKIAVPRDIANIVIFLASHLASHVIMQDIVVDGGATLGP